MMFSFRAGMVPRCQAPVRSFEPAFSFTATHASADSTISTPVAAHRAESGTLLHIITMLYGVKRTVSARCPSFILYELKTVTNN